LNLDKNAGISIFLKKEGKDISSQISFEFANTFIQILKLHGKWQHKNHFWNVFNDKIVPTALLASLTAFVWFS